MKRLPKSLTKVLTLLILIIVPISAFFLGIQYNQSKIQTSVTLKVYKGNWFSFEYPNNWVVTSNSSATILNKIIEDTTNEFTSSSSLSINRQNNPQNISAKEFEVNKLGKDFIGVQYSNEQLKNLFNPSIPLESVAGITYPGECGGENFFINHEGKIYDLNFDCVTDNDLNQILSTFKFTN